MNKEIAYEQKLIFFIFIFFLYLRINAYLPGDAYGQTQLGENSRISSVLQCLNDCLVNIPRSNQIFNIIIYNLNNQVLNEISRLNRFNTSREVPIGGQHLAISIIENNPNVQELAAHRDRLISTYEKLFKECQNIQSQNNDNLVNNQESYNRSMPWRNYVNGQRPFSLRKTLESNEYQYETQDSIAKGLGVSIDNVLYNPDRMTFQVRTTAEGRVLPNLEKVKKIEKIRKLRKIAGISISPREQREEQMALEGAAYLYEGSINIVRDQSDCRIVTRGGEEEQYCRENIITTMWQVSTETGARVRVTTNKSSRFRPTYVASSLALDSQDENIRANHRQLKTALSLITSSVCNNKHELRSLPLSGQTVGRSAPTHLSFMDYTPQCSNTIDISLPVSVSR